MHAFISGFLETTWLFYSLCAAVFAIDPFVEEYPLPSENSGLNLGTIDEINWRWIVEQIRLECNSIDIFNTSESLETIFTDLFYMTASAAEQTPMYSFLLCTTSARNNTREMTFLELEDPIPKEYHRYVIGILEQLIYEQIIYRTGFIMAAAQYIEKGATDYLSDITPDMYKHIFNKEIVNLYPKLFTNYKAYAVNETISSLRSQLLLSIDDMLLYFDNVNEAVKNYIFTVINKLLAIFIYRQRNNEDITVFRCFMMHVLDISAKVQVLQERKEENIQTQFYSVPPFFIHSSRAIKMAMEKMLQTSLAAETLKVRAYKQVSNGTLTIYSLEPKNLQLKYMMYFAMPIYKPSIDIIKDAHKKKLILSETFNDILSIWMAMHYMYVICSSYTEKERIAYYIQYICSDGTLNSFNEMGRKYLYRVALYADALFSYRRALKALEKTLPNVIPKLSEYIEDQLLKEPEFEGSLAGIIKPDFQSSENNKLLITRLQAVANEEFNEFKQTGHISTLPYKTTPNTHSRATDNLPARHKKDSGASGASIFKKITSEKNTRFLAHINDIVTAAIDACNARQRALREDDLAERAAACAANRKQKEAKKLKRIQRQEEEREELKKQEETAIRKNQKNRKKKQKKKEAARAKAAEQSKALEASKASEEAEDTGKYESLSQSDTAEESAFSSSTASEYLSSSPTASPPWSLKSSLNSTSLPARNISVRVLSHSESILKLTDVLSGMRGLDTCNLYQSVCRWMGRQEDLAPYEKAYHCHDLIEFSEAFYSAEEMAHYFLVLVCELSAREYISLYAPATLYIADDGIWHTESGYLVAGGFYSGIQYGGVRRRFNLHHLRLSSTQSLKHAHAPVDAVLHDTGLQQDSGGASTASDTHRQLISPLRNFYQKEEDIQPCQLTYDSESNGLRLVYYRQLANKERRITRVLKILPLSDGNLEKAKEWATTQFREFLSRNTSTTQANT